MRKYPHVEKTSWDIHEEQSGVEPLIADWCQSLSSHRQVSLGEGDPLQIIPVWCPHAGGSRQTGSSDGRCNPPMSRLAQPFMCHRISNLVGNVSGDCAPSIPLDFSNTLVGVATWSVRHWWRLYYARICSSIS